MIIRILMFPVILLLVLYFIIAQVVPTARAISATKDNIVQVEKKLATAQRQLSEVQAFQSNIDAHPSEQAYVMDFVPNNQREEILLSDIDQLAKSTGVSLFSVGFSEGQQSVRSSAMTSGRPHLIEGKMIISGTYENLKNFTHQLFRIKRLYSFKTFDLTKSDKKQKEGEDEEATQQELVLSGVISFAYGYVPGMSQISPSDMDQSINFDFIDTIMQATSQTQPLVSEPENRKNPFLP